jgi:hypothetical protein
MIYNNNKTSLLVGHQLPSFIKDNPDYANFSLFLKAYYEWMELNNSANSQITTTSSSGQGQLYASKNLLSYKDIDNTIDDFIDYFNNDFLPYFPKNALINKQQAVKVARQLYQSKGTPASYQFLFRVLFNSDFEYFQTKDAVLRPSDGQWYVAKSLKLATNDINFRNITQYKVFGETTKSIATIEASVLAGDKTEVFISDVERLFESGEYVRIIDQNKQDVLVGGQPLRAKVVGQISSININPNNRGLTYNVGDPVIVYGGMESPTLHGAVAKVAETTRGSIKSISVTNGGYGYRATPNTTIVFGGDVGGAEAIIGDLDGNVNKTGNVTFLPTESLSPAWNKKINETYTFLSTNPSANVNTKMSDALRFTSFSTYPIGSVLVTSGGGGITRPPVVEAKSLYSLNGSQEATQDLSKLGILAPIQIVNGGLGYRANDRITITGGSGYGAYANVTSVSANGTILDTDYVYGGQLFPLGGMGYKETDTDIVVTVHSANTSAHGASLYVPGILGAGAEFISVVDRAGTITKIQLDDPGEDYTSQPKVSLKVQDILVSNVSVSNLPRIGDTVYQGANVTVSTYQATVNSISILQAYGDPTKTLYNLRVFEYSSNPNPSQKLVIDKVAGQINMVMANNSFGGVYNRFGYRIYGDGSALATATFLNGLVVSQGQYLNQRGQPSSFSVLQNENYNNFTYEITVSREIEKYRDVLLNLLHPSGTKVLGRMVDRTQMNYKTSMQEALYVGRPLYATQGGIGQTGATATMIASFENPSNNIVQFNNIPPSVNLAEVILPSTDLHLESSNRINVSSSVVSVDFENNTVELSSNVWLSFANVATVTGKTGSNTINITVLTGNYDTINNGKYSNTMYPLMDIIGAGDRILVANNDVLTVKSVDYTTNNGIITLTSELTNNTNSFMSVSRTLFANSNYTSNQIKLYGAIGTTYIPELATENGQTLITEDGRIILLG